MRAPTLTILSALILGSVAVPLNSHQHLHRQAAYTTVVMTTTMAGAAPAAPASAAPAAGTAPPSSPSQAAAPAGSAAPAYGGGASGDTFTIDVQNNCASDLSFGIFQVSASFAMNAITSPVSIASGSSGSIAAPFQGIGMRLSATANQGAAAQWSAQALFEFGYSTFDGQTGTAYDLSVMGGDMGLAVYPSNSACPSKACNPGNCAADQGWTNPDQVSAGSPADTVCYQGKTNFRVVWCP